ncbi:helix-turn-helix domain-containing protein [Saccharothrix longispora]|uniref:Tetratricopeptide (TPR) repeat protein n=1 Tax=Saccharothrix longispora TaxID=33920 RepID=A0ABU1Q6W8_9PSEU|nr:helix-turn-helix transcriptional regulator [Saccharothrix longispora]MDR6598431.1 tetratricopeptide (TPR) repeat protein [Saccharothrix longispora]
MGQSEAFGVELRRRRVAAGKSLKALSSELNYSKGHISKIETGAKQPTTQLARLADAALDANGALSSLVREDRLGTPPETDHPVVLLDLPDIAVNRRAAEAVSEDVAVESLMRTQFDTLREMGKRIDPGLVIPLLTAQLQSLHAVLLAARQPEARRRLGLLTARYVEYLGWMAQEAGMQEEAKRRTAQFAALAAEAGDRGLAAYALVRRAELAMYAGDAISTVDMARRALADPHADFRVRGLALHRLAQGYAQHGEYELCRAALDDAEQALAESSSTGPGGPVLGSSTITDLGAVTAGWCLYDLGRPAQAAELLERALSRIAPEAWRARALHSARLALAYEAAGELDRMCEMAMQALEAARPLGSATVRSQLERLWWAVQRRHGHRPARELHVEITAALHDGRLT